MADTRAVSADATEVLEIAAEWHAAGRRVAIATVVDTGGSSPRPVGSQLAIDGEAVTTYRADGSTNASPARFVDFDLALIGLFDDSLGIDIVAIQCA